MKQNPSIPIRAEHVSKRYQLGLAHTSLREAVASLFRRNTRNNNYSPDQLWALQDVSFEVKQGRALGIIGHNGAGKTTLLKLLSKVSYPTSGLIRVQGRVSSLIELGAGFHPDLTGRENVYLNGVILGLKKREIDALFEKVVDFAELQQFIDTPVKRYSSGMYVRLGFSVAAHVEPEILLVDEVLAVGDISFQNKCAERMNQLRANGTTILFVSHSLHAVAGLCDSALLLDHGQVLVNGPVQEVAQMYQRLMSEKIASRVKRLSKEKAKEAGKQIDITQVELLDAQGNVRDAFELGETLVARIHYRAYCRIDSPLFSAGFVRSDGLHVCSETSLGQLEPSFVDGEGVVKLEVPSLRVIPGSYLLSTSVIERNSLQPYVHEKMASFSVFSPQRYIDAAYGVFLPEFEWATVE
jgi:ABC-type polysaccharide/polyol phosphate transport system ATPase subunit